MVDDLGIFADPQVNPFLNMFQVVRVAIVFDQDSIVHQDKRIFVRSITFWQFIAFTIISIKLDVCLSSPDLEIIFDGIKFRLTEEYHVVDIIRELLQGVKLVPRHFIDL